MIDEELYQFASDELNSDRRIKELWNRACALARDDHDEARFLYKNLRVEELLEQQANGEPLPIIPKAASTAPPSETTTAPVGLENEVSLDLEALDEDFLGSGLNEDITSSTNRSFGAAASAADVPEDLMLELDNESGLQADRSDAIDMAVDDLAKAKSASFEELDEDLTKHSNETKVGLDPLVFPDLSDSSNLTRPSSIRGTQSTLELGDTPKDFDIDKVSAMNDAADNPLADGDAEIPDELDEPHTPLPSLDPEISSLAAKASQRVRDSGAIDDTGTADRPILDQTMDSSADVPDDATAFLEAETFDTINADTSAVEDNNAQAPNTDDELDFLNSSIEDSRENIIDQQREVLHQKDALTEELERQADTWLPSDVDPAAAAVATGAVVTAGGAGAIDEILPAPPSLERAELLSGPGRVYRVFSRGPGDTKAVKKGLSWAAMFFTLPWLFVKRMPGTAIVYALLWIALIGGLIVSGIAWLDTPAPVAPLVAFWPLAFAALAVIGLVLIPLVMANRWHAHSLSRRGYDEVASVRAISPSSAVDRTIQLEG